MALKPTISAFDFAALKDVLKSEYKLQSDGNYRLDLDGGFITDKDPTALMNALDAERNEHKATKSKFDSIVKERDDAKKAAELAELQKKGNTEELRKFFEEQQKAQQATFEAQQKIQNDRIEAQKIAAAEAFRKTKALELATELFGQKAPIMVPALLQQIKVTPTEFGVEPVLEFVNEAGQPILGATKDSYKASLLTNPLYKDMIVASHASGGSANGGNSNVPSTRNSDGTAKTWKDYSSGELVRLKKNFPEEFARLKNS